jgi:hypothetical protein
MLPIKLFQLVFCLFRFNRNIETLCFGIEAKQQQKRFFFCTLQLVHITRREILQTEENPGTNPTIHVSL